MATEHGEIFKEINYLFKNLSQLTNGQAEPDSFNYDEDMYVHRIVLFITPYEGMYKDAKIKFEIQLGQGYPVSAPDVYCLNRIYHPNIDLPDDEFDLGGSVCVNLLDSDWHSSVGLDGCVMALLFLFYHPNIEDPLSPVFGGYLSEEELCDNVRRSISGKEVEGVIFDRLLQSDESLEAEQYYEGCPILEKNDTFVENDNLYENRKREFDQQLPDDSATAGSLKYNTVDQKTDQIEKNNFEGSFSVKLKEAELGIDIKKNNYVTRLVSFLRDCFHIGEEKK